MPTAHPKRILVVDDEVTVCQGIKLALETEGHRVDTSLSGEEILQTQQAGAYDLIIIDMMMPGISGLDLLKGLKAGDPGSRVIIVTGYPTEKTAAQALKMGAADYLPKPFTPAELRQAVEKALGHAGPEDAAGPKM